MTRALQSTLFQNPGMGTLGVTDRGEGRKSLCLGYTRSSIFNSIISFIPCKKKGTTCHKSWPLLIGIECKKDSLRLSRHWQTVKTVTYCQDNCILSQQLQLVIQSDYYTYACFHPTSQNQESHGEKRGPMTIALPFRKKALAKTRQ